MKITKLPFKNFPQRSQPRTSRYKSESSLIEQLPNLTQARFHTAGRNIGRVPPPSRQEPSWRAPRPLLNKRLSLSLVCEIKQVSVVTRSSLTRSSLLLQMLRHNNPLNLIRPLINLRDFRVPHIPLNLILLAVSISTENLDSISRHLHRSITGIHLGH